jgi:hypothetical protein
MTKNKKHQPPKENSTNMPNIKDKEVKQIKELKVKYLSEKKNEYGNNHMFAVIDETPLKELIEMADMKMPIWEYNDKYYLKINAVKVKETQISFQKDVPYIMDLTFTKYDFEKNGEQIKGYSISEINKIS